MNARNFLSPENHTPRVDSVERFMYVNGKPYLGYVQSLFARRLELELQMAMLIIEGKKSLSDLNQLKLKLDKSKHFSPTSEIQNTPSKSREQSHGVIKRINNDKPSHTAATSSGSRDSANSGGNKLHFEQGQVLFSKGDEADSLMIILDGSVEIFDPMTNKSIAVLGKGSSFGEQAILEGGVRTASARAHSSVDCLQISTAPLRNILKTDPGILTPVLESLLLQLHMANTISRMSDPSSDNQTYEIMSDNKYSSTQLQKLLYEIYESGDKHGLSSQDLMFYRLQASSKFITTVFKTGDVLAVPGTDHSGSAYILTQGRIMAKSPHKTYILGPGSVIGLAEGLSNAHAVWTVSAMESINILTIPIDKALRGIDHANAGIRGVIRYTTDRIIELQQSF